MSSRGEVVLSLFKEAPSQWSTATWSCLLVPLVSLLAVLINHLRWRSLGDKIPGPQRSSLLTGNYQEYRRKAGSNRNVSAFYEWLHERYGTVARYWLGVSDLWVSVSEPALVKSVLQNATERPPIMKKLLGFLGEDNQTFKKEEFARPHRTVLLQQLASPKALSRLATVARSVAKKTADAWAIAAERGDPLDLCEELTRAAAEVMTRGLFGEPFERLSAEDKQGFVKHLANAADGATKWGTVLVTPFWKQGYREWKRSGNQLHQIAARMIKNHQDGDEPNLIQAALRSRHKDGGRVTSSKEEMTSFLIGAAFGGYDTTAMAMSWAILKLAEHPEVQAKVQQELDTVVAGELPTQEELPQLDYLGAVILETGRLWPAASALLRHSDADLKLGEHKVLGGTNLVVPIQAIHRSTLAWGEDAREFRPERWQRTSTALSGLPGVVRPSDPAKVPHSKALSSRDRVGKDGEQSEPDGERTQSSKVVDLTYAASLPLIGEEKSRPYFTFGSGPRSCVGRLFSLTEQKLMLATILKRFKIELVPRQGPFSQVIRGFVARPSPSPQIVLVKR